jgi:hypothetical protein
MTSYYTVLLEPTAETGYSQSTVHSIWKSKEMAEEFVELHRAAYPEWNVRIEEPPLCDKDDLSLLTAMMDEKGDNPLVDDDNVDNSV